MPAVSDSLYLDVAPYKIELGSERHLMSAHVRQQQAQQLAEPRDHLLCAGDVLVHHGGDRMKRVEQEMRLKLRLHQQELRLSQASLAVAISIEVVDCLRESDDGPVRQQVRVKSDEQGVEERRRRIAERGVQPRVAQSEDKAGGDVECHRT